MSTYVRRAMELALSFVACAWLPVSAEPQGRYCEQGQVPIVWPLGTGFEPQRLLISHGQYLDLPPDQNAPSHSDLAPYLHAGIDVAACVGDEVYAVESGVVEYVGFGLTPGYNQVVIADLDEEDVGWSYLHLEAVFVAEGDTVERDQAIGTLTAFPGYGGFNHLHLQRVAPSYGPGTSMADGQMDAGNPLPLLVQRRDTVPPRVFDPAAPLRFLRESDPSTTVPASALAGIEVDVVAQLEDSFPGVGPPACWPGPCEGEVIADEILPARVTFSIFREVPPPAGISYPTSVRRRVFHNVVELDRVLDVVEGPPLAVFHPDTVSHFTQRKFVLVLTHCQETGVGSFQFVDSGEYFLQLVLEDASSNATLHEMFVTIP